MIRSAKFTCILDTNVLHPLHIRDYLLYLADAELYTPKWSKHIFDEWVSLMESKATHPVSGEGLKDTRRHTR